MTALFDPLRLDQAFLTLPLLFDAEALAAEVRALPAAAWVPHPGALPGNDAVLLVTPGGQATNAFLGPMAATAQLRASPHIMGVMETLGAVWGRSRLMGLAPGARVPEHVDVNYHWRTHTRIHVPIITSPDVRFRSGEESVHMAPGSCWTFDSFRVHDVHNGGREKRVHLVLDTVGGEGLWELIRQAKAGADAPATPTAPQGRVERLHFERVNAPRAMSPWEVRCHLAYLDDHLAAAGPKVDETRALLDRFVCGWSAAWAEHGETPEGVAAYRALCTGLQRDLMASGGANIPLKNKVPLLRGLNELIFQVATPGPDTLQGAPLRPAAVAAAR